MVYAVISDVHGNQWALEAVLRDIRSKGADLTMNLGDSVYGPLLPHETAEILRDACTIHILGNQDRILLEPPKHPGHPTFDYCMKELTGADLQWLRSSHMPSILLDDLLLFHGTHVSDQEYLLEDVRQGWPVLHPAPRILQGIGGTSAHGILCGHSHVPRCVRVGDRYVVNPGSVGLQAFDDEHPAPHRVETGSPDARYCLIRADGNRISVEHVAVPYDVREAVTLARKNGRADWAAWLEYGRV